MSHPRIPARAHVAGRRRREALRRFVPGLFSIFFPVNARARIIGLGLGVTHQLRCLLVSGAPLLAMYTFYLMGWCSSGAFGRIGRSGEMWIAHEGDGTSGPVGHGELRDARELWHRVRADADVVTASITMRMWTSGTSTSSVLALTGERRVVALLVGVLLDPRHAHRGAVVCRRIHRGAAVRRSGRGQAKVDAEEGQREEQRRRARGTGWRRGSRRGMGEQEGASTRPHGSVRLFVEAGEDVEEGQDEEKDNVEEGEGRQEGSGRIQSMPNHWEGTTARRVKSYLPNMYPRQPEHPPHGMQTQTRQAELTARSRGRFNPIELREQQTVLGWDFWSSTWDFCTGSLPFSPPNTLHLCLRKAHDATACCPGPSSGTPGKREGSQTYGMVDLDDEKEKELKSGMDDAHGYEPR
ncbi:hypothetical protein C8R45DRAFT_1076939 [Mycena sanguinolenta]|nr:hypothetical protein C8R45DRAFT_1076939 [Mycena sanguinolenta]